MAERQKKKKKKEAQFRLCWGAGERGTLVGPGPLRKASLSARVPCGFCGLGRGIGQLGPVAAALPCTISSLAKRAKYGLCPAIGQRPFHHAGRLQDAGMRAARRFNPRQPFFSPSLFLSHRQHIIVGPKQTVALAGLHYYWLKVFLFSCSCPILPTPPAREKIPKYVTRYVFPKNAPFPTLAPAPGAQRTVIKHPTRSKPVMAPPYAAVRSREPSMPLWESPTSSEQFVQQKFV